MAYVKTHDGKIIKFPYSIGDLRRDNPHTSFPRHLLAKTLSTFGVFEVTLLAAPSVDQVYERATRDELPSFVDNSWVLQWSVVKKTEAEQQEYADKMAAIARSERDKLIADTDWMALSDNTLTSAWAAYRQALRDVTAQAGFPHTVDWPVKP